MTLRIGFIGCGVIAHAHAFSLEGLKKAGICDVETASAYDPDAAKLERFTTRVGAKPAAGMAEVSEASDAVYVCTSTAAHLEAVRTAATAGKPIFCEKPLARNLPESLSLVEAAGSTPVQVGLVLRTAPAFIRLAEIVSSGELGRPMACQWRDDQFFPIQGHYGSKWRSDVTIAGAGALLEHSIHDIDIIAATLGAITEVTCATASYAGHAGIEDSVTALLRTTNGLSVSLVSVWHDVLTRPSSRRVEMMFERGFVTLEDDFTGPLTIQTSQGIEIRQCPPPAWVADVPLPEGRTALAVRPYVEENHNFVDAVVRGKTPAPTLADAVAAHRVVDACYRSAAEGAVLTGVAHPC